MTARILHGRAVLPASRAALRGTATAAAFLPLVAVALLGSAPLAHAAPKAAAAGSVLAGVRAESDDDGEAPKFTPEESEAQAALVDAEDHRLDQVRAVAAVAPLKGAKWSQPYRLDTGSGYTLVLTARTKPYGVSDLLSLAPQTFVRKRDGSYLLTENLYLNAGAKLKLSNPGGLTMRMASSNKGFVSIVSFGGRLILEGTAQAPMKIGSWDTKTNKPDTDPRDGRAYIRAIGGQFAMKYAAVSDLGFWSGRTGGLSLTGTDRPDTGNIDGPDTPTSDDLNQRERAEAADKAEKEAEQIPSSGGVLAQPSGELTTPDSRFTVPDLSYVSAEVDHSTIKGNTYGLFVSGATGVSITDTKVSKSFQDGLVLHRYVTNADVARTTSKDNGGDGFVLARATQQVQVTGSTASGNKGNGFTLSGRPLASGPSASGESISSYGSNSVSNSTADDNGRYGIEILGGMDVGVQNNNVRGGDMGIVARQEAAKVAITGNHLKGQVRQGISVRDGVTEAQITGNIVENADTGVYVRDSVAEVRGNTIQDATNHGVSMVGGVDGSTISYNVIAGVGPSALDTVRAGGDMDIKKNQTFAWHDTSSFWTKFRHYASPMTLLWTFILLLILMSAVMGQRQRGNRGRGRRGRAHPYADKKPLPTPPPTEIRLAAHERVPVMTHDQW
ncbi:right-handed parallel beta-helix repeat-containing protein [Streptomyces cavernae]|uniref:right-handed parallel beta-helix repeat-containing protein n=1 Tax=Streptomyces cavernae TaxID=2259034 RepID=UPI001EE4632B|nr:right-handed parallel beta-helix repeat-containing protein [Streptomyces cavernae]